MFVAWFTYDTERPPGDLQAILGEPGHRWLTAQGSYSGDTALLDVYTTSGGVFDSTEPAVGDPVRDGTLRIHFANCSEATAIYEMPRAGLSGAMPLQRIVADNVALCETLKDPQTAQ